MPAAPALFIVLEGIDGSGTTTQATRAAEHLRARGRDPLVTREPSRGPIGVLLREILLGRHARDDGARITGDPMALLFAADRQDHLFREIEPALAAGRDVICDRYQWSSLAYQAEETDQHWVAALGRNLRRPDLTVFVDVSVSEAAARRARAGRPVERYDDDSLQARVAATYRRLAESSPDAVIIDGNHDLDTVTRSVASALDRLLEAKKEMRP